MKPPAGAMSPHPATHTSRRPALAALAWLLLAALIPSLAMARPLALTTVPALPTWADEVRLVVAGNGCDPALGAPRIVPTGPHRGLVEVDLHDVCNIVSPPVAVPFRFELPLGNLPPGTHSIRVTDLEGFPEAIASLDVIVYDVSTADLEVVAEITDRDLPDIRIGALHGCDAPGAVVEGRVIRIEFADHRRGCPILWPVSRGYLPIELDRLPPGLYEVRLFDHSLVPRVGDDQPPGLVTRPLRVWSSTGCVPAADVLCLREGRFALRARWRDFAGATGAGEAEALAGNDGSGLFRFFGPDNVELTLKVLDGCAVNGHWWVFLASSSTVEYEVEVTDTATGAERRYGNALDARPRLVSDVAAFACP